MQPLLRTGGVAIQAPESPQFAKLMDGLGAQLDPFTGGWRVGDEASAEMAKLHLRTAFGWREEPPQTLANVRLELDGTDADFASAHEIRLAGRLIAVRRPGEPVTLVPGVRVVSGSFPDTQVTDPTPIFPEPILPAGAGPVTLAVDDVPLEWAADGRRWLDFEHLVAQAAGMSGGQLAFLRMSASIADAGDVQLGGELARLDRQRAQLVMIAVAHVTGATEAGRALEHDAAGQAMLVDVAPLAVWPES